MFVRRYIDSLLHLHLLRRAHGHHIWIKPDRAIRHRDASRAQLGRWIDKAGFHVEPNLLLSNHYQADERDSRKLYLPKVYSVVVAVELANLAAYEPKLWRKST